MSSEYYTAAQLEARRKEELRQNLLLRIAATKKQLEDTSNNTAFGGVSFSNIDVTVAQSDEGMSGLEKASVSTASFFSEKQNLSALDYSSILSTVSINNNQLIDRLSALLTRIDERPILRKEDKKEHERLISGIHKMMLDKKMDIEDTINLTEMRVRSFLSSDSACSARDVKRFEELRLEYRALCSMLEETEKPLLLDELELSVPRMEATLLKHEEDGYILHAIEESMDAIGFRMQESCSLEKKEGVLYVVDNSPLCDVFVSQDGGGFLFETIVNSEEESLNRRNQVEENARSICSKYNLLEEEVAKRGVILSCIDSIQPKYEIITSEAKVVTSQETRKKRQKQNREMHMEG